MCANVMLCVDVSIRLQQVIRVKKLVGLPPPALELLASYSVNQGILCVHMNEIKSIIILCII